MQEDISEQRHVVEAVEILRTMMMKKQWKMAGKRLMNLNLELSEMQEDISEQRLVVEAAEILRTMMKKQWKMTGKRLMTLLQNPGWLEMLFMLQYSSLRSLEDMEMLEDIRLKTNTRR